MDEVIQSDHGERARDSPVAAGPAELKNEIEFQNAKAYLLTNSSKSGLNLLEYMYYITIYNR